FLRLSRRARPTLPPFPSVLSQDLSVPITRTESASRSGTSQGSSSSATRRTPCRRSAAWASTTPSATPWRRPTCSVIQQRIVGETLRHKEQFVPPQPYRLERAEEHPPA